MYTYTIHMASVCLHLYTEYLSLWPFASFSLSLSWWPPPPGWVASPKAWLAQALVKQLRQVRQVCVISSHFNIWLATSTTVPAQHLLLETCRNSVETSLQAASRRCANRQYDLGLYLNTWGATSGPKIKVLAIFGSCAKGHNEGRWRKQKNRKSWWSMGKNDRVCASVCVSGK